MKRILFFLYYLIPGLILAQYQITIDASVLDYETKQPIEYSEVGFYHKDIITLTDNEGKFQLLYNDELVDDQDLFIVRANGYQSLNITASQVYKFLRNTNKFYLKPQQPKYSWNAEFYDDDDSEFLYGKVFSVSGPIQGATIRVKNKLIESKSDFEGYFTIKAKPNDILVVNYLGMDEKQILVDDMNDVYVLLKTNAEILDEVVLNSSKAIDKEVDTGFGKKNKDAVGFSTSTITAKDISPAAITLVDVIKGKFAGVQVGSNQDMSPTGNKATIYVRGGSLSINNSASAIFDVDGMIYTETPDFLDPQQIESITLLRSIGATNKYGSEGRGGVFIIKMNVLARGSAEIINSALIKGNDYSEVLPIYTNDSIDSYYIKELKSAKTFIEAKTIYEQQKKYINTLSVPYYFECYDYFSSWDRSYAYSILTSLASLAKDNPKALKALAFKMEEIGKLEDAKIIYQYLLDIRPSDEQSYRDLALIYKELGENAMAVDLYTKMLKKEIPMVDMLGLEETIANEAAEIYFKNKNKTYLSRFPVSRLRGLFPEYIWKEFGYDYRIVFDWTDPNIEFNVQFVNPKNKYFNWSHTVIDSKANMIDEIQYGYNTEEFIIDDSEKGDWIINIENFTIENNENPTYLKYTVFKNYGRPNQIKKLRVINLSKLNQKITLDKLLYYN
ncbi:MAG: carboxypeptidase-like regulatory domain-containing protein [Bacteroidota bacterium]|nr:carboxypeptidase-like regulatory domain-containing protein [Bacteroidota bacterium]